MAFIVRQKIIDAVLDALHASIIRKHCRRPNYSKVQGVVAMQFRRQAISLVATLLLTTSVSFGDTTPASHCSARAGVLPSRDGTMKCTPCQNSAHSTKAFYQQQRCVNGKWLDVGFCGLDAVECKASINRKWPRKAADKK
jgi:hypothetical protein